MLAAHADIDVLGEGSSAAEAVAAVCAHQPDVVLMDLRMPGADGVQATKLVLALQPQCRVVVLTTYDNDADILRAVEAGASGYLLKDATPDELAHAIRAAAGGGSVLAPSVAAKLVSQFRAPTALSPRGRSAPPGQHRPDQRGDRPRPAHQRSHGEDTPHEGVQQAGRF
jgi:DNA-binding NarL/FixJ family response regulator